MAAVEGALRIKRVGRTITLIGILIALVGMVGIVVMRILPYGVDVPGVAALVVYFGLFPAFLGGAMWAAGWIVEGFVQRPSNPIEKS